MTDFCRLALLVLAATVGCGPTSDWPGDDKDLDDDETPPNGLDGGSSGSMDAGSMDAGRSNEDCSAPDAGVDAGCSLRDL